MADGGRWLEVSLRVDGELAEAAAEVLARYAPGGVVIENTSVEDTYEDSGSLQGEPFEHMAGSLRVLAYLPADERLEQTRRRLEEALWHLGQIRPLPSPQYRLIQETNWMESWKQHYQPLPIGRRLLVLPAWLEAESDGERLPIRIDPGMAFGTGTHPSTQLALELLEEWLRPGQALIDVGCGSGILAVAAASLGAQPVLGVDVDAEAVSAARQTAALNALSEKVELGQGSVAEVRSGAFSLQQAPLVVANILAPVLIRLLAEGLGALVSPGGALILSGILAEQEAEMLTALESHGLTCARRRQIEDWVALAGTAAG